MSSVPADMTPNLRKVGVVPVLTISDLSTAIPLAKALAEGGLNILEITLRTQTALDAISEIRSALPECIVGAGTILNEGDVDAAYKAGSQFLVSPGTSTSLVSALLDFDGPAIPGVATASEALCRLEEGFALQKFFPAEAAGGAKYLKSIAAPMPGIQFMPTGGVSLNNANDYLSLPNVAAVGGSWLAPTALIETGKWDEITKLAKEAAALATA